MSGRPRHLSCAATRSLLSQLQFVRVPVGASVRRSLRHGFVGQDSGSSRQNGRLKNNLAAFSRVGIAGHDAASDGSDTVQLVGTAPFGDAVEQEDDPLFAGDVEESICNGTTERIESRQSQRSAIGPQHIDTAREVVGCPATPELTCDVSIRCR